MSTWEPFKTARDNPNADWSFEQICEWYEYTEDMRKEFEEIGLSIWITGACDSDPANEHSNAFVEATMHGFDSVAGMVPLSVLLERSFSNDFEWTGPITQKIALEKLKATIEKLIGQCDNEIARKKADEPAA